MRDDKTINLLVIVAEECSEITHAVTKALRFGTRNHHPQEPHITNADSIMIEYAQLTAVIEALQKDGQLPVLPAEVVDKLKSVKMASILEWDELQEIRKDAE